MTADERIEELLARAGQPVMVVENTEEADSEKKEQIMLYVRTISRRDFGGSVAMYFQHLTDTIDRLEAALSNVINEREQLKRELHEATTIGACPCCYCEHENETCLEEPCHTCMGDKERPNFKWHGIPEGEAEHGEV